MVNPIDKIPPRPRIGGHGHVFVSDHKARCGGPMVCNVCKAELAELLYQGKEIGVTNCARCHKDHSLKIRELSTPCLDHNYWGLCPNSSEPILVKIIQEEKLATN